MLSRYLQTVTGIENVGAVSLVVAFALFVGIVVWTVKRSRRYTERMSQLPLDDDDPERTKKED